MFARVKKELTTHEILEEEILYPAFEKQAKLKNIVLEGYAEHHVVDTIMGEIGKLSTHSEMWGAKLRVMKENVEHHIEEEEGEMFKKARALFDEAELKELGARMHARKKEVEKESPRQLQATRKAT